MNQHSISHNQAVTGAAADAGFEIKVSWRRPRYRCRSPLKMNSNLPSERDFDPYGGDLDAQCAWRNFGGLTLEEATRRFRERLKVNMKTLCTWEGVHSTTTTRQLTDFLRDTLLLDGDEIDDRQSWILHNASDTNSRARTYLMFVTGTGGA